MRQPYLHKLIVIDDEEEVREGLRDFIPWHELGFQFLGAADNGLAALQMTEELHPDVVLCDINMPIMDGLEFAEIVASRFPKVRIMFLTGYDEFEYAQKAIKLKAIDFLLKPLTPGELEDAFRSLKEKLVRESQEKQDLILLKQKLQESIPILKERYLHQWASGRIPFAEISRRLASVGLHLRGEDWACFVMDIKEKDVHPFREDPDLLTFAIANVSEEFLRDRMKEGHLFVNALNQPVAIVSCDRESMIEAQRQMIDTAYALQRVIQSIIKVNVTIGVGGLVPPMNLAKSYGEAQRALDYRFLLDGNDVLYIHDVERNNQDFASERLVSLQSTITNQLKVATLEEVDRWVDQYFFELTASGLEPEVCKVYVMELVALLSRTYQEPFAALFGKGEGALHPLLFILQCKHLHEMKGLVQAWCKEIVTAMSNRRESFYEQTVRQTLDFIQAHYDEEKCSIQMICDHLHISPSYFSYIFKKITGETFTEYVTGLRLQKARELLRTTSLKTYEVAEKVGFNNIHYFSTVFKKNVGVTPSDYRKRI